MNSGQKCPLCKGKQGSICHINTGLDSSGHHWKWVDCLLCSGSGEVGSRVIERLKEGSSIKAARIKAETSLVIAARKFGVSSAAISAVEMGRKDHREIPGLYEHFLSN